MPCKALGCVNGKVTLFSSVVDCDVCGGTVEEDTKEVVEEVFVFNVVPPPVPSLKGDLIDSNLYDLIDNKGIVDILEKMEFWRYNNVTGYVAKPGHFHIYGYAWTLGSFVESPYHIIINGFGTYEDACKIKKIIEKHLRIYW